MTESKKSNWLVDQGHSEVQFKVKHLGIANVSGTFKVFNGSLKTSIEGFTDAAIAFEIETDSIDTNNPERDGHLKGPMLLNAERFPKITFAGFFRNQEGKGFIEGDLTILETTKRIKMEAEHIGNGIGRWGDTRAGFEISGKINRKDFGVSLHVLNDLGNLVIGDEVKLHLDIELINLG